MNSLKQVAVGAHEMIDASFADSRNHQNDTESNNLWEDWAQVEDMMGSSNSDFESEISQIKELVDDLIHEEDDIKGQLLWLECHGKKRKRQVDDWLEEVGDLKKRAHQMIELVGQGRLTDLKKEIVDLTIDLKEHAEFLKPLVLSNELVGGSFETNIKKLWKLLGDDHVFIIGIYGMGGVGKTTLVTHIKNEITRKGTFNFKHVVWITVSQDFSIFKLQNDIAKRIGVKLDDDDDEGIRAEILYLELERKEKSVFILDDVWKNIDLQKVGIPLRVNGIKLILTSRLKHVCQQMDCPPNNIIHLLPLDDEEEAWELFLLKLGYHGTPATLPLEVEKIAKSIAEKCNGLPLGISVVSKTMKGVNGIHRWRHALNKLQNLAMEEDMEGNVFKVLKLSYDNLMDKNIQNCFLHCALYSYISAKDLIVKLVEEGLINGMRSLEEIFDEGHTILDKLESHSLLLRDYYDDYYYDYLRMHVLVRDMACHNILKERGGYMVKCDKGLTRIPHMQEWTADLEKVSLMKNKIKEIPEGTSPWCPLLSTFIFSCNLLCRIPDSFFSHMNALAVLDLSNNQDLKSLPTSVSNLRSLISLLLGGCTPLKDVPPLGQLQKLSRLVISNTSIEQVPQGLEMLMNLKWLDLSQNEDLTLVPGSMLPGLTNMQYLDLHCPGGSANVKVKVEDVQGMSMLECFASSFHDCENFNDYVRKTLDRGCGPKTYNLHLGIGLGYLEGFVHQDDMNIIKNSQIVHCGDCEEFAHLLLPTDIEKLYMEKNKNCRCLCNALSFNGPSSLNCIAIRSCPKLESLFCLSGSCSLCTHLQKLESLDLQFLESLDVIWKENDDGITQFLPPCNGFFHLSRLEICECHSMEKLLAPVSLRQLPNLVTIRVARCNSMKEIFAVRSSEDGDDYYSTITLPKLQRLELKNLLQLKTVCRGIIVSGSPPIMSISDCPNLERALQYKSSDSNSGSVILLEY